MTRLSKEEARKLRKQVADALQKILIDSQYREDGTENVAAEVLLSVMTYAVDFSMHLAAGMEMGRADWVSMASECSKDHWKPNGKPLHPTIADMEDE